MQNKKYLIKSINNIKFGYFSELNDENIISATSFRTGGVSRTPHNSLNLALHTKDEKNNVLKNREIFFSALNIDYRNIITLKQIHSNRIFHVGKKERGRGGLEYDESFSEGDGLLTADFDTPLVIFTADCLPIFFYEKNKKIIGLAHAGWKGSALNIVGNMIDEIIHLGGRQDNILVGIGPGIESKCYEVGREFYFEFNKKYIEIKNEKYYLDITMVNYDNLIKSGVKKDNIFLSDMCTFCNSNYFFSYRRDGETGRMASVIMLKK